MKRYNKWMATVSSKIFQSHSDSQYVCWSPLDQFTSMQLLVFLKFKFHFILKFNWTQYFQTLISRLKYFPRNILKSEKTFSLTQYIHDSFSKFPISQENLITKSRRTDFHYFIYSVDLALGESFTHFRSYNCHSKEDSFFMNGVSRQPHANLNYVKVYYILH